MNNMEPCPEKVETLKDIIEDISSINNEMNAQLQMIADALAHISCLTNNGKGPDDRPTIIDTVRYERDRAAENLKLLVSIRGYLW